MGERNKGWGECECPCLEKLRGPEILKLKLILFLFPIADLMMEEGFAFVLFYILLHVWDIFVTLNNLILRLVGLKTLYPVYLQ